jgi:hypothetical protein
VGSPAHDAASTVDLHVEVEAPAFDRREVAANHELFALGDCRLVADTDVRADGGFALVEVYLRETQARASTSPTMVGVDSTTRHRCGADISVVTVCRTSFVSPTTRVPFIATSWRVRSNAARQSGSPDGCAQRRRSHRRIETGRGLAGRRVAGQVAALTTSECCLKWHCCVGAWRRRPRAAG